MQAYESKLLRLVKSRKFWALVSALVATGGAYATGAIDAAHALNAALAALGVYILGTGIEDNGRSATPPTLPPPQG